MSLNYKKVLALIAQKLCRDLRANQTKAETILWEQLRNRKFYDKKFLRQHPILFDLLGKETLYITDFYCHELKLVIEVNGEIHEFQKLKDAERETILNHLGLSVLRIRNKDVEENLLETLNKIKKIMYKLEEDLTHPKSLS